MTFQNFLWYWDEHFASLHLECRRIPVLPHVSQDFNSTTAIRSTFLSTIYQRAWLLLSLAHGLQQNVMCSVRPTGYEASCVLAASETFNHDSSTGTEAVKKVKIRIRSAAKFASCAAVPRPSTVSTALRSGFLLTLAHGLLQMFIRYARATVHVSELRSRRKRDVRDVQPPHQHRNQRRLEEISDW
ncbi:hypothetical protein MTO96_007803 [Rhipicephalus appendiculatus]